MGGAAQRSGLSHTDAGDEPGKRDQAFDLVAGLRAEGRGIVQLQALLEYFVAATGKLGVDPTSARRRVEIFSRFALVVPELEDVNAAIDLTRLQPIPSWDAMIVRSAPHGQCRTLLTEDMAAGTAVEGAKVVNHPVTRS